jgi:hypothetical protein
MNRARSRTVADSREFDRRLRIVEDALYALKESGYANSPDVATIDNFLALPAELKVELYGHIACGR